MIGAGYGAADLCAMARLPRPSESADLQGSSLLYEAHSYTSDEVDLPISDTLEIPRIISTPGHMHLAVRLPFHTDKPTEGTPHMGLGPPVYPPNVLNLSKMCHVSADKVMACGAALRATCSRHFVNLRET
jgi:hypothetical protein